MSALIYKIGPEFVITCTDQAPVVSAALQREVDRLWEEEKRLKGAALFDGLILSAVEVSQSGLVGRWVNYRYALTVYRKPHLAPELGINPVAVNGFTVAGGRVLLARRAEQVAQYPGCLELAPSGGIDPQAVVSQCIDYRKALLDELEEETGISRQQVEQIEPFALIYDPLTAAWELVLEVRLAEGVRHTDSAEYSGFVWVEEACLGSFLQEEHAGGVVPLTRVIAGIRETH